MAKYLLHPKHPLRTIAYVIIAVGLVVGGFVTLKASQTSTEGRSKAAKEGKTYARWEFNGVTPEGWEHLGLQSFAVSKGKLRGVMSDTPETSYVFKNNINTKMDRGNKKLSLRMAVRNAQVLPPGDGPTPTYAILDESGSSDAGDVDCTVSSNGVNTCSTSNSDSSTQSGSDAGGFGNMTSPTTSTIVVDPTTINIPPCVARPTCDPGVDCLITLQEPIGGWCPEATPTPSSCTPCTDPRGFCPLEEYGEPMRGWCPPGTPVPTPPPCQNRLACLDTKPFCKIPTPIGGWCPSGREFTFDVMYAYEEEPVGGDQGMESIVPRRVEKIIQLKGQTNGRFYRYNLTLPEIGAIKVVDLKITFVSGINPGSRVIFDWIRLTDGKKGGRKRLTGVIVPTWTPAQCGKRCKNDSACSGTFTCIQPIAIQCQGFGCRTRPAKKVCALAPAQNAKGYICEAGGN